MKTTDLNVIFNGQQYAGWDFAALPLGAALVAACEQIDLAADTARRTLAGDTLRALEHQTAAEEAKAFAQAGYNGEAPPSVQAWMDAAELDAQAATESILAKAQAWQTALYAIRAARLNGKQGVLKAATHAAMEYMADQAIVAIQAGIEGVDGPV
ncbi:hypothetical protein [Pseudomonas sp. S1(2024)]|uniref:hypothetical protein n=1 Tax=Pseudomonas sp. S1(2024) TaxID=3390191 RepID=UPI00397BC2E3